MTGYHKISVRNEVVRDKFSPNALITSLYEQKKRYQPNMLMAIGITLLLSALTGAYISTLSGPDEAFIHPSVQGFIRLPSDSENNETTNYGRSGKPVDLRPARYHQHEGFAGFNGYKLFRSYPEVTPSLTVPDTWESDALVENIMDDDFRELSLRTTDFDFSYDEGIPRSPLLIDHVSDRSHRQSLRKLPTGENNTKIDPGERDRPSLLKLHPVKYPRKGWYVNGTVKLILVIDARGNIKESDIVDEDPEGMGFAQVLKDALNESSFFPPIIDGEKREARYELTYEFCWECPQKPDIRITGDQLVVSSYGNR